MIHEWLHIASRAHLPAYIHGAFLDLGATYSSYAVPYNWAAVFPA
jgi:hypothetical protein